MILIKYFQIIMISSLFTFSALYAEQLRIMPLGDSITYDNNHADDENPRPQSKRFAYRGPLWEMLKDSNISFDFVGTRHAGQDYAPDFDPNNEGYPGQTSYEIAEKTYSLLQKTNPNVILLHIGTNDHSTDVSGVESILNWINTYENDTNSEIRVIVALIISRQVPDDNIEGFNKNLLKMLTRYWENGDMITIVDMYGGLRLNDNDYADITHPNANGYAKIARKWYEAIITPYEAYSSAPQAKNDKVSAQTGTSVSIDVTANDIDLQHDLDRSSVTFVETKSNTLTISNQGNWSVDHNGIVTFVPVANFTSDPTPVLYTIKDLEKQESKPAKIIIDYSNASLESFPTTLVDQSYIESTSINESTNTIEFITRVPDNGITF